MIPSRFANVSFDTYRRETASQQEAFTAVHAWLENLPAGPMLALVGKQGTGKSHLLYSAASGLKAVIDGMDPRDRMQGGVQYPFVAPWYSLADQLRYGRTIQTEAGSRQKDGHEVRAELWSRKVVMLDEVRPTSGTNFDDSELAKFACHAYDNRVAVLITTNVHPLADVMGAAAASRFLQIVIDGPDARQAA
jgi:hypothetical protein